MFLNLLQSPLYFLKIILILFFNVNHSSSSSTPHTYDSRYEACINPTTTCGMSNLKIAYPFWGNGRPKHCGHPEFNLSCDGSILKLTIMSLTYHVLDIDYTTSTLKIVNEHFSRGKCPESNGPVHNTTLDWDFFRYTSDILNATVYYGCHLESKALRNAPYSFACERSYPNRTSFLMVTNNWAHELGEICEVKVYVPIHNTTFQSMVYDHGSSKSINDTLKRGFEVNWVIDDDEGHCQDCYKSGGNYCLYNVTLDKKSTCFCANRAYPMVCQPGETNLSVEAKVAIGLGVSTLFIFVFITIYVFMRGKNHYHSSTTTSFAPSGDNNNTTSKSHPPSTSYSSSVEGQSSYFGTQLFSYNELLQATSSFDISNELGKGGFGTVYYGKLQDGREVAIKRLYEKHNKQVSQFMNELEILTRLDHKNLVKLYGCTTRRSPELLLVYEYIPNGTIADHLQGNQANQTTLPWAIRLRIAIDSATALVYLHAKDIIHRDVKCKNILLTNNFSVKVVDFGLSRLFPVDVSHVSTTPQGSPGYVDPEYHQCYHLTNKSDVYSFGVVLAELISAKPPVDITRNRQEINLSSLAINKILQRAWDEFVDPNLRFEEEDSKVRDEVISVAELTYQCLQATSESRPSMEQVLKSLMKIQGGDENLEEIIVDVNKDDDAILKGYDSVSSSIDTEIKNHEEIVDKKTTISTTQGSSSNYQ